MSLEVRLRALEREVAELSRRVPTPGLGNPTTSTAFGATTTRPYQTGFPAKLTSVYDATTGYDWAIRTLTNGSAVIGDPTIPLTGTNAVELSGRTDLDIDTEVWMELDPGGLGYIFQVFASAIDCAWLAGLSTTDCLVLTIVATSGTCSGVDDTQLIALVWDGGTSTWRSGATDWTGTGSGGTGRAVFDFTTDGMPRLLLDGVALKPLSCSGGGFLFAGGGATLCGGSSTPCADYFIVRIECSCCPATGFAGDGFYCVVVSGMDCSTGNKVCVEYLDSLPCTGDVVICSGPYATSALCEAACTGSGASSGGTASCCGRALAATLYGSLSGGYGTVTMTWDGSTYWIGSRALTCGETLHLRYTTACGLEFSCNGSSWAAAVRLGGSTTCGPPFTDTGWLCDMDSGTAGCAAGSCATVSVDISE